MRCKGDGQFVKVEGTLAQPHILIVENNEDVLALEQLTLRLHGYRVTTAHEGAEALAAIGSDRPALILLDLRMPGVDGATFAQQLTARGERIPIIVVSALTDARRRAAKIGAINFLAKPFTVSQLVDVVRGAPLVETRR